MKTMALVDTSDKDKNLTAETDSALCLQGALESPEIVCCILPSLVPMNKRIFNTIIIALFAIQVWWELRKKSCTRSLIGAQPPTGTQHWRNHTQECI